MSPGKRTCRLWTRSAAGHERGGKINQIQCREADAMSLSMTVILAGAAGGVAWAGVTLAATWWFNRRVRGGAGWR